MSTPKPLPSNLKQLEQQTKFKQFYKQHTAEQLEEKLIEAGIEYGQDENKAALTWRVMDANGVNFEPQPQAEKNDHANDDVPTAPTPKADDSKTGNNADDSEQPSAGNEPAGTPTVDDKSVNQESGDHVETNPSVSANGDSVSASNGGTKEQPNTAGKPDDHTKADTKAKAQAPANKPAPQKPVKAEREHVEVTNNGTFSFFETATGTLVRAKETVKIYTTPTIDKARIMRNVDQYNYTRGNKLSVSE